MGDQAAEVGAGKALCRLGSQGLADDAVRLPGEAGQYLPLFGGGESFETGMPMLGAAQDVLAQGVQQSLLAGMAQQEVGAGLQVLAQLAPGPGGRGLHRPVTNPDMPQPQAEQRRQGDQCLGKYFSSRLQRLS